MPGQLKPRRQVAVQDSDRVAQVIANRHGTLGNWLIARYWLKVFGEA